MKMTNPLRKAFQLLYQKWRPCERFEEGYAILVPSPMDMPFLLRFTLEGLRFMDTSGCRQILVIPDGLGNDGGAALQAVMNDFNDPRLQLLHIGMVDRIMIRLLRDPPHWLTVIYGINAARTRYAFLHDADAFFLDVDGIKRIHQAIVDRKLNSMGVTARWDPFFTNNGYQIPGTWEMIFSCEWIRKWKPFYVRGQTYDTPYGRYAFDTLLWPQFTEFKDGRVGVMENPPSLVHFNGTITTYRAWSKNKDRQVTDALFRVLLISLLEEMVPSKNGDRLTPPVQALAKGLTDPNALVRYERKRKPYIEFREQLTQLCRSPVFAGERGNKIEQMVAPFDAFYEGLPMEEPKDNESRFRSHGLA